MQREMAEKETNNSVSIPCSSFEELSNVYLMDFLVVQNIVKMSSLTYRRFKRRLTLGGARGLNEKGAQCNSPLEKVMILGDPFCRRMCSPKSSK